MAARKKSFVEGAAVLAATIAIVKVIGALYKLPLYNILDDSGTAYFGVAYNVYSLLLTVSTAGVPVAISRMIASENARGRIRQSERIFSVAMPAMIIIGAVFGDFMMLFCRQIANFMEEPGSYQAIFTLGPAVFFCCVIAVYRGYTQGHEDMIPTSITQISEVVFKFVLGLAVAFILLKAGYSSGIVVSGAIFGVVVGLGVSIPIMAWYRRRALQRGSYRLECTDESTESRRDTLKEMLKITIPMTLSSSLLNLLTLIDVKVVMNRLKQGLMLTELQADVEYATFTKAHTLFTLPSSLIVAVSISVVPAVAAAIAVRKYREAGMVMGRSLKLMNLFAMPAGVGMCVLAAPLYYSLYGMGSVKATVVMAILGIASYFVCFQLVSTALVQASGHERIPLIAMAAGSILKVIINYTLTGHPAFGIVGAPISTLVCYLTISLVNMIGLKIRFPEKIPLGTAFLKPVLCTALMAAAAAGSFAVMKLIGLGDIGGGRLKVTVGLIISIGIAVVVYFLAVILLGAVTREDMEMLPKGEKIAEKLHLK